MIDFNATLQLFIGGEEYDFDKNVSFEFHSTNFTSITLNNVIKKSDNVFPLNMRNYSFKREFTIAELHQNGAPVFIGIVNDIGRLNINPNTIKTFSIKIADFRRWLSLTKPINKIYINKTPAFIVNDLITKLNEPKIQVGNIPFTGTNAYTIKAYNTTNKSLYQVLKDVLERQTNSFLHFTTKNGVLYINYKTIEDLKTPHELEFDVNDKAFFETYQIMDVEFDSSTTDYYNFLSYSSDNIVSTQYITERGLTLNEKITLKKTPVKIINDIEKTYIYNIKQQIKRPPIILNTDKYQEGQFYDILYSNDSNVLDIKTPNPQELLTISYHYKKSLSLESQNLDEIRELANSSKTKGIVFKYEKFNDLTDASDLLNALKNDLNKYSSPNKVLTLTCRKMIWDVLDAVNVKNVGDGIDGVYVVQSITGRFLPLGNDTFQEITYQLQQSKNMDTVTNKYDNQSYRDNPVTTDDYAVNQIETISSKFFIVYEDEVIRYVDIPNSRKKIKGEYKTLILEENKKNVKL